MHITQPLAFALFVSISFPMSAWAAQGELPGVDFANEPGVLYVPARGVADALKISCEEQAGRLLLNGKPTAHVRTLFGGTKLIALHDLDALGVKITWDQPTETATVQFGDAQALIHRGSKHAVVKKKGQILMAYQGSLLVLQTHVSTGRRGHSTPSGEFAACSKERIHYSRLYDDSPMPYAVQVHGNVFIHGFTSVPRRPASHGCIRVPLTGKNAARYFYQWIDIGTPVSIQ